MPSNRRNSIDSRFFSTTTFQVLVAISFVAFLGLTINKSVIGRRASNQVLKSQAFPSSSNSSVELSASDGGAPIVEISNGRLRGRVLNSRSGREFSAFYQIPYAEPPVGKLRFQAPKPFTFEWDGIRDATSRGGEESSCVQLRGFEVKGKEDCLRLSVFTPQLPSSENPRPRLPVMVYIFGGTYTFGRSNRYGPDYIMDEDVVLVLFDFRVGAFGHLNTEDMEIRGNMAQKDQAMALRWIQKNIVKFGGDPKRVLIFGNSSGGGYVNGHLISKMSKGLFSRAISQSGSVFLEGGISTRPIESVKQLGLKLNCTNVDNTRELHECLIDAEYEDIARNFAELQDFHFFTKEYIPDDGSKSDVFFEDYPINLLANGSFNKDVPWIAGNNNAEGFPSAHQILTLPWAVSALNENWDTYAPKAFDFEDNENHTYSRALRKVYFGSDRIDNSTRYDLVDIESDVAWVNPVRLATDSFSKNGGRVYVYYMTHEPLHGYGDTAKLGFRPPYGAAHADEVQYLFPFTNEVNMKFPYIGSDSVDYQTSRNMIGIWTRFARDGVPSAPGVPKWPMIDRKDPRRTKWLEINNRCRLIDPLTKRMRVLESIPFRIPLH